MTSRFPPNLGKIATSLYKIIAGDSQTHIILGSGTQTRFAMLHQVIDALGSISLISEILNIYSKFSVYIDF